MTSIPTARAVDPTRDLTISRIIAAPRSRIWEAWTDPAQLEQGWRPADAPFLHMTATITMRDHADGTEYFAVVQHARPDERARHEDLGFADGWGTVTAQLAALTER